MDKPLEFIINKFDKISLDLMYTVLPIIERTPKQRKAWIPEEYRFTKLTTDQHYIHCGDATKWDMQEMFKVIVNGNILIYTNISTNCVTVVRNKKLVNLSEKGGEFIADSVSNAIVHMLTRVTEGQRELLPEFSEIAKDRVDFVYNRLDMSSGIIIDILGDPTNAEIYHYKRSIVKEIFMRVPVTEKLSIPGHYCTIDEQLYHFINFQPMYIRPFIMYEGKEYAYLNQAFELETFIQFMRKFLHLELDPVDITEWRQYEQSYGNEEFLNDEVYHGTDEDELVEIMLGDGSAIA